MEKRMFNYKVYQYDEGMGILSNTPLEEFEGKPIQKEIDIGDLNIKDIKVVGPIKYCWFSMR